MRGIQVDGLDASGKMVEEWPEYDLGGGDAPDVRRAAVGTESEDRGIAAVLATSTRRARWIISP